MGDPAVDTNPEPDYFDLSDEDFDKLEAPVDVDDSEEEDPGEDEDLDSDDPEEDNDEDPSDEEVDDLAPEEDSGDSEEDDSPDSSDESDKEDPPEGEDSAVKEASEEEVSSESKINYKAEYEKFMAPFKANGREVTPKSPEDAQRLMQMGANYHKKMAGMKPALLALKTLENNGLLEPGKLDFLIDVHQGKEDAIAKLLKDSKINPVDVDVDADSNYQPADHSANESEVALESVLVGIQDSPNYNKTLDVVGKEWDEASRGVIASNPQIIEIINSQMDAGVYDQVMAAVDYERSMGRLNNVSDLEAYKYTGTRLEQEGAFNPQANSQNANKVELPKADVEKEQKRKAKKRAASPTKSSAKVGKLPDNF